MSHLNPDPLLQDSELPLCPWCNQPYRKWHDNCQRRDVHHVWELGIQPDESRGLMKTHAERMKAAAEEHIKQRDLREACGTAESAADMRPWHAWDCGEGSFFSILRYKMPPHGYRSALCSSP